MNGETTFATPWKAPTGGQFDLNASYKFKVGGCEARIIGNINNLFDQEYIIAYLFCKIEIELLNP